MPPRSFGRILLAILALTLFGGGANADVPSLKIQVGNIGSIPVTTGSVSYGGVTVNGVPVVGSIEEPELQTNGLLALRSADNPLDILSTEYNLGGGAGEAWFTALISGTLEPQTSLDWSVYYDPSNKPYGEATLLASGQFTNTSAVFTIAFSTPPITMFETIDGPFSLTEVLTIAGPIDRVVSFNSSVVANVPEPSTWAMTMLGFAGCGLVFRQSKGRRGARA